MALQIGLFTGLLAWIGPFPLGLAAPLTFTVVEATFPTLFPWRLAHSQYRIVPLLQSGEITGPYLLGFAIVWVNAGVVRVVRDGKGGAEVMFELSQRRITIHADRSPSAAAMIEFAEAAAARGEAVYATIDSGPLPRTKGDDLGPFVLTRLADTPDPATVSR